MVRAPVGIAVAHLREFPGIGAGQREAHARLFGQRTGAGRGPAAGTGDPALRARGAPAARRRGCPGGGSRDSGRPPPSGPGGAANRRPRWRAGPRRACSWARSRKSSRKPTKLAGTSSNAHWPTTGRAGSVEQVDVIFEDGDVAIGGSGPSGRVSESTAISAPAPSSRTTSQRPRSTKPRVARWPGAAPLVTKRAAPGGRRR